ncbi:MAG: tetratricopeptide repeat protein [bacterium]|nr:MAG: tetratricopeptide repeat protein [bacterium]
MKQIIITLIILISVLTPVVCISQQNFSRFLPNAHSIGIGGSDVAVSYDPAASYWNPASIAFLTTNRVLINIDDKSYLNHIGLTKFFPPSLALGMNIFRSMTDNQQYDMATVAMGYRIFSFLSVGTNFNFSKTINDQIYSSFGVGLFFKTCPDYRIRARSDNPVWNWLTSNQMRNKFNFGISFHNITINNNKKKHETRIGTAIKPHHLGPLIHFAYHLTPDDYSLHLGTATALSKHTAIYFGINELDLNKFAVGGALEWGPFEIDMSYDFKYSKIYFSFMLRLSEEKNLLFQKYKELGNQQIKANNFSGALKSYLKAFAYQPDNEEVNYLISVLQKESNQASQKIDSLFVTGEIFKKKGWLINAFITYRKILEIDQNNRKARRCLKALNSKLNSYLDRILRQGKAYYDKADLKRGQLIFKQILLVNKNHQVAKTYLAKIDSINSNTANEHFYRGLGYYKQKNLPRAKQEFKDALTFNPDHEQAKEYLEETQQEIENSNRLINQYLREAKNYERTKQYVKASINYRKVLEIDKAHQYASDRLAYLDNHIRTEIDNKFNRARRLYDRMDYSRAIAVLREILSIDPDHGPSNNLLRNANQKLLDLAEQHYQRAQNFFNQKKWDIVLQECNLTLSMNPDHSAAKQLQKMALANIDLDKLLDRGLKYYDRGDYLSARSIFRQVLAKEPNNVNARNYLNRIETDLRDRVEELFNMGMVKYADGDYEAAIKEWNKILEIDPDHKSAKEYIQKAQERIDALKRIER